MAETIAEINFNDPDYAEGKRALQEYLGALRAKDWETARLKIANVFYALGGTSMRAERPTDEDLLYEYQKMKNMQDMLEKTVDMYQIASTSERMSDQQYNDATTSLVSSYMNNIETLLSNQLSGVNTAALERAKAEVTADQDARDKALDAHYADLVGMEERLLTQSEISAVAAGAAEDIAEEARSTAQRTGSDTSYGQLSREELALAIYNNIADGPYRNAHAAQAYGYISDDGVRIDLGIEPRLERDDTPGASSREERALARLSGWDGTTGTAGDHLEAAGAATNTVTLVNSGKRLAEARRYDDRLYGNPETGLTRDGNVPSTRRFYGTYLDDASADAAHAALSSWVLTSNNPGATAEDRTASLEEMRNTLLGSPMGNDQTIDLLDTYTKQVNDLDDMGLPTMLQKRNAWRESDLGQAVLGTSEAAQLGEDTITRQVGRQFMPGLFGKGKIKRGVREDVREGQARDYGWPEEGSGGSFAMTINPNVPAGEALQPMYDALTAVPVGIDEKGKKVFQRAAQNLSVKFTDGPDLYITIPQSRDAEGVWSRPSEEEVQEIVDAWVAKSGSGRGDVKGYQTAVPGGWEDWPPKVEEEQEEPAAPPPVEPVELEKQEEPAEDLPPGLVARGDLDIMDLPPGEVAPPGQGDAPERGPAGPGAPPEALPPKSLRSQVDEGATGIIRQRLADAPPSEEPEEVAEEAPAAPPGFAPGIEGVPKIFPFARRRREQEELKE